MFRIIKTFSQLIEENWKLKIIAFWILSFLPRKILFFLQHNITNRSSKKILTLDSDWLFILEKINELNSDNDIKLLEQPQSETLEEYIKRYLEN